MGKKDRVTQWRVSRERGEEKCLHELFNLIERQHMQHNARAPENVDIFKVKTFSQAFNGFLIYSSVYLFIHTDLQTILFILSISYFLPLVLPLTPYFLFTISSLSFSNFFFHNFIIMTVLSLFTFLCRFTFMRFKKALPRLLWAMLCAWMEGVTFVFML